MSTNLIGYKNFDEKQRVEFEESTRQKQRKNLFLAMLIVPVILIVAFQVAIFFTDNLGGRFSALIIGVSLSIIFEMVLLVQAVRTRLQKDFEGEVIKKKIKRKTTGGNDNLAIYYRQTVTFRTDKGKKIKKHWKSDFKEPSPCTWYGYLNVGDKVRFHAKMDYYEKYDKSEDSNIPCAGCGKYVDIMPPTCSQCGAPLIKPV